MCNSNNDMIKVYLFYLKENGSLYAFTIDKEYKDLFLNQRNKKCFYLKKVKMHELEYSAFSYSHKVLMLSELPLSINITDYEMVIATYKEEEYLMYEADNIDSTMNRLKSSLLSIDFKEKYKNSIDYLTEIQVLDFDREPLSKLNLLFLFTTLFKNTFEDS